MPGHRLQSAGAERAGIGKLGAAQALARRPLRGRRPRRHGRGRKRRVHPRQLERRAAADGAPVDETAVSPAVAHRQGSASADGDGSLLRGPCRRRGAVRREVTDRQRAPRRERISDWISSAIFRAHAARRWSCHRARDRGRRRSGPGHRGEGDARFGADTLRRDGGDGGHAREADRDGSDRTPPRFGTRASSRPPSAKKRDGKSRRRWSKRVRRRDISE